MGGVLSPLETIISRICQCPSEGAQALHQEQTNSPCQGLRSFLSDLVLSASWHCMVVL